MIDIDNDYSVVIVCAGPPLCMLEDEDAITMQINGCQLCKRIVCHPDGTETIIERILN